MSNSDSVPVQEWAVWQSLECHEDFIEQPPLLQCNENFTENSKYIKCILCNFVCPPPPYSCEIGHLICFSCTSVQKGSICPIQDSNTYKKENNSRCGKVLKAVQMTNYDEQFSEPRKTYSCPFAKFGCGTTPDLTPEQVVEHAQKRCQFRYRVKCFFHYCNDPIRVGNFKNHIKEHHGANEMDLDNYQKNPVSIPVKYFCWDLSFDEEMRVPLLFVNSITKYMFAFVVKKIEGFFYFWLYEFVERDVRKKQFQGRITIVSRVLNKWDAPNSEDLVANDAIHDPSVPPEDVIKTDRLIKINIPDFENGYIGHYQQKSEPNEAVPHPYHFYVVKINISKKKNVKNTSTSLSEDDYRRLESLPI